MKNTLSDFESLDYKKLILKGFFEREAFEDSGASPSVRKFLFSASLELNKRGYTHQQLFFLAKQNFTVEELNVFFHFAQKLVCFEYPLESLIDLVSKEGGLEIIKAIFESAENFLVFNLKPDEILPIAYTYDAEENIRALNQHYSDLSVKGIEKDQILACLMLPKGGKLLEHFLNSLQYIGYREKVDSIHEANKEQKTEYSTLKRAFEIRSDPSCEYEEEHRSTLKITELKKQKISSQVIRTNDSIENQSYENETKTVMDFHDLEETIPENHLEIPAVHPVYTSLIAKNYTSEQALFLTEMLHPKVLDMLLQMHDILILFTLTHEEIIDIALKKEAFLNLIDCLSAAGQLVNWGFHFQEIIKITGYGQFLNNSITILKLITELIQLKFTEEMIKRIIAAENDAGLNILTVYKLAKPMLALQFKPGEITTLGEGKDGFKRLIRTGCACLMWDQVKLSKKKFIQQELQKPMDITVSDWQDKPIFENRIQFALKSLAASSLAFFKKNQASKPAQAPEKVSQTNEDMVCNFFF